MSAMRWRGVTGLNPVIALPLIVAAAPIAAHAAGPCYPRDAIHAHLAERYGERPAGVGVTAGQLVELLVRPDGASWTILVIRPDGLACPVAAGEDWTDVSAPTPEPGESSS
ncbi:MAG: hypothetical protein L0210_06720 [Rhodospirillales bacterium]|nr:hypothetical protein [Rhodospirillales bacterium]